jgi:GT2 family glycosyltransferase
MEIIVVDNASKDGSCEWIKAQFPFVKLIENKENVGFPKANNQGFEIAKGKFIFMLNPDTEFIDSAIDQMLLAMEQHPEIGFLAPKLLNTDGSHQPSVWRFPRLRDVFFEMYYLKFFAGHKNYRDKNLEEPFYAESFSGAAILFRSDLLKLVGGLDERMFWIEDVEFCYRLHDHHIKGLYFPQARIFHHIGQSAKKNYNISISNQVFNKIKFFRRHHAAWKANMVIAFSFVHAFLKWMVFLILSPINVIYFRKSKAYAYTMFKVFNPPKGII